MILLYNCRVTRLLTTHSNLVYVKYTAIMQSTIDIFYILLKPIIKYIQLLIVGVLDYCIFY